MKHLCDNCNHVWEDSQIKAKLADIPNLGERLDPGSVVPSGECPDCGALVYPEGSSVEPV